MSASNVGDVTSLTGGVSTQSAGGNIQVVSLSGGVSTMSSSGATTCYKKKTCEEGYYSTSIPDGKKCDTVNYNGYTCYTNCSYMMCKDYNSNYESSIPSGKTCTAVTPRSGLTCYKDCKNSNYTLTHKMTLNMTYIRWTISDSSGNEIGSGSKLASNGSVQINDTYTVPAGEYTVKYEALGWVPCDQNGRPKHYCACEDRTGTAGSPITTKTFTVNKNTVVPYVPPYCGHDGCTGYPCKGGSGGIGIQPME